MSPIERRALYNLVRMNWLNQPALPVQAWQVEDYRALPLAALLERLNSFDIALDRDSYRAYADACDSPEELIEHLWADRPVDAAQEDQAYLLIFELWRRLASDKPSLSVLCYELDHQIFLYDRAQTPDVPALQDALAAFIQLLEENVDQGISATEAFQLVSHYFANDIAAFLYDFIAEHIDRGHEDEAHELLEDIYPYLGHSKWFKLLRWQLCQPAHTKKNQKLVGEIIEECLGEQDLDYNLEFLSVAAAKGDTLAFLSALPVTLPLVAHEEDLQDLLAITMDYCHSLDRHQDTVAVKEIIAKRVGYPLDRPVEAHDRDLMALADLLDLKGATA